MDATPLSLIITALVVFTGGLIQGTVAFGMGIFLVVSLAWLFPASSLIPFVTLAAGVNLYDLARRRRVRPLSLCSPVLIVPTLLGALIGTVLLVSVPDRGIKAVLGLVVATTGVLFILRPPRPPAESKSADHEAWEIWTHAKAAVTFIGGILGGWLATAGPPMVLYAYSSMPVESAQRYLVRAFLMGIFIKIFIYAYYGLWTLQIVLWAAGSLAFVLLGTAVGHHLATRLPPARLGKVVWSLFAVMGIALFARTVLAP